MNDSKFLDDFYGSSMIWFRPCFCFLSLLAVFPNSLLIWITLSTPSIRIVHSYWLVACVSFCDLIFGLNNSLIYLPASICGKNGTCPLLVKICAGINSQVLPSALVLPTLIMINRYLTVTTLPTDNSRIRKFLTSNMGVFSMILFAWSNVVIITSILASYDGLGEELFGHYGAKPFTSFWLYLIYLIHAVYGISSRFVTFYFYAKLEKFVQQNMRRNTENLSIRLQQQKDNKTTKAVMKMVKLSTLIPMLTGGVALLLDGGQWFIPHDFLPMWGRRLLNLMHNLDPICTPLVAMSLLGPYKRELKLRFSYLYRSIGGSATVADSAANLAVVSVQ